MSVFKPWRPDTKKTIEDCIRYDLENWKVFRICKNPEDLQRCEELIINNYEKLKLIFLKLISSTDYPYIGQLTISQYAE